MTHRALLPAALVLLLGAASAAPSAFGADTGPAISVRPGVGGAARPGRWLPVDVAISSGDTALHGAVVVEWGGALARRDIDMAAATTAHVTLLVRTIAASPSVRVTLATAGGSVAASSIAPVTLLPVDDPATLCIGETPASTTCTLRISDAETPTSWRGFDLADDVVWNSRTAWPGESSRAFALWQAARWWQNSGFVDPVVAPFDTDSRLSDRTSLSLAAFVASLFVLSGFAVWRRARVVMLLGVPLAVAAGGVALVTRSSRDVDIQSASFVHQFAGVPQSIVLMKGDVEHPGARALELVPDIADGSVDVVRGLQHSDSSASVDGRALYRNTAGRGVSQRFELNGTIDHEWLTVTSRGGEVVVENRSAVSLDQCQLRSAELVPIGTIGAGVTARIVASAPLAPGDAVVCQLPADWLTWSAPSAAIATRGSAFLIFHIWPAPPAVPNAAR